MCLRYNIFLFFFFQAEDGIRDSSVTGVQTCALPICAPKWDDRYDAVHHGGVAHRPLQRLHAAHRGADDGNQLSATSRCCELTMSRMLNFGNCMRGCTLLFDGEVVRPFPIASVAMMKYFESATARPGRIR